MLFHHTGWYMWWYHFIGTYLIAGVTLAYAVLALSRLRPRIRLSPERSKRKTWQ